MQNRIFVLSVAARRSDRRQHANVFAVVRRDFLFFDVSAKFCFGCWLRGLTIRVQLRQNAARFALVRRSSESGRAGNSSERAELSSLDVGCNVGERSSAFAMSAPALGASARLPVFALFTSIQNLLLQQPGCYHVIMLS